MFELLCVTGFIMFYLFISCNGSLFAAICLVIISLRFGHCFFQNHELCLCVSMLLTNKRLFFNQKATLNGAPIFFTGDPDSFA